MSPAITILLLCIGIPLLLIVAGIALCARYDRQYLGVDDEVHP